MGCVYILKIKPLLVNLFGSFDYLQMFFHSINGLFIFFIVSFPVQTLVSLIRFY